MALTLIQLWQQQHDTYDAEQKAAQQDFVAAQAALNPGDPTQPPTTPAGRLAADQAALDKVTRDITTARAKLAVTTIPAESAALLDKITALIITQRGLQGSVLDDREDVAEAQANGDIAAAVQARAAMRLAGASDALAKATASDTQRTDLKNAASAAPFATLKNDATAFLAGATVNNAQTRLGKNFPAEIIAIAKKRYDTRVNRLKSLRAALDSGQNALAADLAADNGLAGVAAQKQIAFARAEAVLRQYLATAKSRFDKAVATMKALEAIELAPAGTVSDILSDAEKAQSVAKKAAGAAAEPTAAAIDDDLEAVYAADNDLDAQILTQIGANVDQLSTDPTVKAKRDAIGTNLGKLKTAKDAFKAANKADLDQWEAVIPDAAWQVLLDFEDGMAALNELSAIDPAALAAQMDTAENDYATARAAAELAQRRVDYLGDAIALRQKRVDTTIAALSARLPSAIRGDSF